MTQSLSEHPSKVEQHQQHGKRKKSDVEEKQHLKVGKKAKAVTKKVLKPQVIGGNTLSAEAVMEEYGNEGQGGENTDDILSKYRFLTVTKQCSPLKMEEKDTVPAQRKGVPKITGSKAKLDAQGGAKKKAKVSVKNVAHFKRSEDGVEEKCDEAVSSRSQVVDEIEAAAMRGQLESASSPVNNMKEESMETENHSRKFSEVEESSVNTANILNKYKFLTDVAELPREDEVEEVTMEETTEEDLLGRSESQEGDVKSNLVEAIEKEGRDQAAKNSKKSSSGAAVRKERVPCEQCEKTFATSSSLKQHINVHTNETPYQCKECPDKFRSYNMLARHRKKAHPKSFPDKISTVPAAVVQH